MTEKIEELRQVRIQKLEQLKKAGIDPYPVTTQRTHSIANALSLFDHVSRNTEHVTLAGRIKALRAHGKLTFANLEDESGSIQLLFRLDGLGPEKFKQLELLDIGDFVEAVGSLALSKTGEKSLEAASFKLLSKSLRPIPQEHFGLKDLEIKLRKRYLDFMVNKESREIFKKKALFWKTMREFLEEKGFLEVQLPVLEDVPGGAEAEPFITHHNALNRDFYLRISLELPLKKLLVGGFEKVFEIGRIFRNEGISTEHLQDYTQMEFYWAYADYDQLMDMTQDLYQKIVQSVTGGLKTVYDGKEIDWSGKWPKIRYFDIFKEKTGLDLNSASDDELRSYAKAEHIKFEDNQGRGRLVDLIFKKKIRPSLVQPIFLINPPIEIEPLAKKDPKNSKEVQRMNILAAGTELGKGFSELNDPQDQRERFEAQMKLREMGDPEAQMLDEDFVEALEYGMPPAAGFGLSERLFTVIMDRSIRETVIFPPMAEVAAKEGKSKVTLTAVAVINKGAKLESWQELNTIAHLTAAFGAREGRKLLYQDEIGTKDEQKIKLNIQHAIMIKSASSNKELQQLIDTAKKNELHVAEFIREMIETTDDKKIISSVKSKSRGEVEYLGVLVFGKKPIVEKLTESFNLYK